MIKYLAYGRVINDVYKIIIPLIKLLADGCSFPPTKAVSALQFQCRVFSFGSFDRCRSITHDYSAAPSICNELFTPKRVVIIDIAVWVSALSTVFIGVIRYFQVGEIL